MKIKNKYLNSLKIEDLSLYGYPVEYASKDYDNVLNQIKKMAAKTKEILSIYTFGEISVPGISDMDFIFVLKKNSKLPSFLKKNYMDKDSKYLTFHPFFIVTENIMENIRYIYPNSNFISIYGKEAGIYNPSKSEIKKIKISLTIDFILRHLPVDYLYILLSKRINVRMVLLRLNSMRHSFKIFKDISGKEKLIWENFSKRVYLLRNNWFNLGKGFRENKLLALLKEAVYTSTDFVNEVNIFLSKNKANILSVSQDSILFKGNKNRISFVRGWDMEKAIDQMIDHFSKHKNFYSILPISFLKQLCHYSGFNRRLSLYIRKRLNIRCFQGNIDQVTKKRIQILNEQVDFANRLKHQHYPCFFPLGYKTETGFKNKLILLFVVMTSSSIFRRILFFFRSISKRLH
ncbi:hypothetical protein J4480_05410 [Candidatus Woesearchaeota archaeon]|nr:hypothetical protein [Candidatus Woesearchaeota archaeon]